jgi:hypothetical protein
VGFFDEYRRFQFTSSVSPAPNRLNKRYQATIEHNRQLFSGNRIIDVASHDGRWSFAAVKSGAAHVTGIEARPDLVDSANQTFKLYEIPSDRYRFIVGDALEWLRREPVKADLVLLLGFFYHIWQHIELVRLVEATGARHVIVDTAILPDAGLPQGAAMVWLMREKIALPSNQAIADHPGSNVALVGYPSRAAVRLMFDYFGFDCEEFDWRSLVAQGPLEGIADYAEGRRTTFLMTRR